MNISAISKGLIASLALLGATACTYSPIPEEKAEKRATKFLTGEEYLKAKEISKTCSRYTYAENLCVQYWDSLLLLQKADEAYVKGVQMVRDSVAGKKYTKPNFNVDLNKNTQRIVGDVIEKDQQEIAKAHSGEEFRELLLKAPDINASSGRTTKLSRVIYWNKLAIQGAEREAFNRGVNDEKAKVARKSLEVGEVSALK